MGRKGTSLGSHLSVTRVTLLISGMRFSSMYSRHFNLRHFSVEKFEPSFSFCLSLTATRCPLVIGQPLTACTSSQWKTASPEPPNGDFELINGYIFNWEQLDLFLWAWRSPEQVQVPQLNPCTWRWPGWLRSFTDTLSHSLTSSVVQWRSVCPVLASQPGQTTDYKAGPTASLLSTQCLDLHGWISQWIPSLAIFSNCVHCSASLVHYCFLLPCWSLFGCCFLVSSECVTNPPLVPPQMDLYGFFVGAVPQVKVVDLNFHPVDLVDEP